MLQRLQRRSTMAVAGIVAAASLLAIVWLIRVPIFQAPDEITHLDYALQISAHHRLLSTRNAPVTGKIPRIAHPWTQYLIDATRADTIKFHPEQRMDPNYGTRDYFKWLSRQAPVVVQPSNQLPPLFFTYPFGYYAVLAVWLTVVKLLSSNLVVIFFSARALSVLLLTLTLPLVYRSIRALGRPRRTALLVTFCVGCLPLTSFVASYVQPDNLAFALSTFILYLTLRLRRSGGWREVACLGVALGLLLVTKPHCFLCVGLAACATLAVYRLPAPPRVWLPALGMLLTPALVFGLVHLRNTSGTANSYLAGMPVSRSAAVYFDNLLAGIADYLSGASFQSFWRIFGWMDTPIIIRNGDTTRAVRALTLLTCWLGVGLSLLRTEQIVSRVARIFQRGRRQRALQLLFANPLTVATWLFVGFMLVLYTRCGNIHGAQGRNWLPVLPGIVFLALVEAPRGCTGKWSRRMTAGLMTALFVGFATIGSAYALKTIQARYYPPRVSQAAKSIDDSRVEAMRSKVCSPSR